MLIIIWNLISYHVDHEALVTMTSRGGIWLTKSFFPTQVVLRTQTKSSVVVTYGWSIANLTARLRRRKRLVSCFMFCCCTRNILLVVVWCHRKRGLAKTMPRSVLDLVYHKREDSQLRTRPSHPRLSLRLLPWHVSDQREWLYSYVNPCYYTTSVPM